MKKLEQKEYGISAIKSAIGAIPFAGTFLNEFAFEARSRIKQERVNKFIMEFSEFFKEHFNPEFDLTSLNVEQISDVFEELIISVSKTSAEHKRKIFKQVLLNQLTSKDIKTDETLRFINITNELTRNEFNILTAFHSLSDNVLKYKVQIIELEYERNQLMKELEELSNEYVGNDKTKDRLKKRQKQIPRLIKQKRSALKKGDVNPNHHSTFDLSREVYISEIQDLISKGLLFDFALRTQIIDPFVHFGITELGRGFMNYISSVHPKPRH